MRSKPVSADGIFENQEHPNHRAGGNQSSHNRGDDQNVVERANRGSGGRRRSLPPERNVFEPRARQRQQQQFVAQPQGAAEVFGALVDKGAALGAPVGPPGGSVGSLMVGAVDGFGGKLIRTVSFLGWTLPVSFFTGGTAPVGAPGMFEGMSAIIFSGLR
jgi:hypothetical protein